MITQQILPETPVGERNFILSCGDVVVNLLECTITENRQRLAVDGALYKAIAYLVAYADQPIAVKDLYRIAGGLTNDSYSNVATVLIYRVRKKFQSPDFIKTVKPHQCMVSQAPGEEAKPFERYLHCGNLSFDLLLWEATRDKKKYSLTFQEARLLIKFMLAPNHALRRAEIDEALFPASSPEKRISDKLTSSAIYRLNSEFCKPKLISYDKATDLYTLATGKEEPAPPEAKLLLAAQAATL